MNKKELIRKILPRNLIDLLNKTDLSKTDKEHCYRFYDIMLFKHLLVDRGKIKEIELYSQYFETVFGDKYYRWLRVLKELRIIECGSWKLPNTAKGVKETVWRETYVPGVKAKVYRLNFDLLSGEFVAVYVKPQQKRKMSNKKAEHVITIEDVDYTDSILATLKTMHFDKEKLMAALELVIQDKEIDNKRLNLQDKTREKRYNLSLYDVIAEAYQMGKNVIQDRNKIYIEDIDVYVQQKQKRKRDICTTIIEKLCNGEFYLSRAESNGRIHLSITELPTELMSVIMSDNDLTEIDLYNSQFVIAASKMEQSGLNTEDFELFKTLAYAGNLYQYISLQLFNSEDKIFVKKVKQMMFECLFSSERRHTTEKKKLKMLFPSVIKFIDDFKKERRNAEDAGDKPHAKYAIELQKAESAFFIDYLFPRLNSCLSFVLTKHDSIIVKKDELPEAFKLVKEAAQEYNFPGTFKCNKDDLPMNNKQTLDTITKVREQLKQQPQQPKEQQEHKPVVAEIVEFLHLPTDMVEDITGERIPYCDFLYREKAREKARRNGKSLKPMSLEQYIEIRNKELKMEQQ
jgi:hypothetical protein